MRIEQAIFTSLASAATKGYHIAATSSGIGPELVRQLSVWSPSHGGLIDAAIDAESLNHTPVADEWTAVSRTVYGGPEYSQRGGLQVVTLILAVRREQWSGYEYHPLRLIATALALGYLRLPLEIPSRLPMLELPDRPLGAILETQRVPDRWYESLAERIQHHLCRHEQLAVVGVPDARLVLNALLARTPPRQRLALSFTTGLKPSLHRPFRIHFLPHADRGLIRQWEKQGIVCLSLNVGDPPAPIASTPPPGEANPPLTDQREPLV